MPRPGLPGPLGTLVEINSTDLNPENVPAIETVLACSLGLVVVEASSRTVRLIHSTLQEYLSNSTDLFRSPHGTIAQVCLSYLHLPYIGDLSPNLSWSRSQTPFLGYTSCFWGTHIKKEIPENVDPLALKLLPVFDEHASSGVLLSSSLENWDRKLCRSNPKGFSGLHVTAFFGIVNTAVALREMGEWDLDVTDAGGNTAISWAARKGHRAMVQMLLELEDISPDTVDNAGRTPLSWAAGNGYEGAVKMFLEWGTPLPTLGTATVERLSRGQLEMAVRAPWRYFWSGGISLPTLPMNMVEPPFRGQLDMGGRASWGYFWDGRMSLLELRMDAVERPSRGQLEKAVRAS